MPEYLSPGVYVEEVETGAKAIEGVSTSTAAFLGRTERGPVQPEFLTSFADFKRKFGGYAQYKDGEPLEGTSLAYAVDGFFRNGGSRCYVGRITTATKTGDTALGGYAPPLPLTASPAAVEFGEVVVDREVTETVEIENAGIENDPDIEVTGAGFDGPPGNASQYSWRVEGSRSLPATLPPKDSLSIEVTYKPGGAATHDNVTLDVVHDGASSPTSVDISGTGKTADEATELAWTPDAVDFGTVATGTTVRETLTVENAGLEGASDITFPAASPPSIINDAEGAFTVTNDSDVAGTSLAVGASQDIEVEVTHGSATDLSADLELPYEVGGSAPPSSPEEIPVRAETDDPAETVGASATTVEFANDVPVDFTVDRTVTLRNMDASKDAVITNVTAPPGEFDATLVSSGIPTTLAPGGATALEISFTPGGTSTTTGQVNVEYEVGSIPPQTRSIDVSGGGEEYDGEFESDPVHNGTLAFDDVVVDESEVRTVALANSARPGASPVTVTKASVTNDTDGEFSVPPEFDVDPPDQPATTLEPGESTTLPVTYTPTDDSTSTATLEIEYDDGSGSDTRAITLEGEGVEAVMDVEAVGPGPWGGRVAVTVRNGPRGRDTFNVTIRYWTKMQPGGSTDAERVDAQDDPAVEETFSELSADQAASNYYVGAINSGSNLVEVTRVAPGRPANGTTLLEVPHDPEAGTAVTKGDFEGDASMPRGERTGLAGFAEIDEISIVSVPDEHRTTASGVTDAVVGHCERMADRFAVLQAPRRAEPEDRDLPSQAAVSDYAAIYYPHVAVLDPETGRQKVVPPGGHIAGIYARTDAERGVHKAPANVDVRGVVELDVPVTKADQELLNPKGVNAIRSFPGRGIRVWGARTTSANPSWKYVNVRRLFLYVEESIQEGTQWAVFEPNDEKLWARVRQSVRNFLTTVWRNGGLMGSSPDEAFYVKADRTTMTQDDIDNGRLIVEVGIAPVKPAEFVVFRITQWTEGVEGGS